jgi:hypothetical protein
MPHIDRIMAIGQQCGSLASHDHVMAPGVADTTTPLQPILFCRQDPGTKQLAAESRRGFRWDLMNPNDKEATSCPTMNKF